jgi:hypothetical protein
MHRALVLLCNPQTGGLVAAGAGFAATPDQSIAAEESDKGESVNCQ